MTKKEELGRVFSIDDTKDIKGFPDYYKKDNEKPPKADTGCQKLHIRKLITTWVLRTACFQSDTSNSLQRNGLNEKNLTGQRRLVSIGDSSHSARLAEKSRGAKSSFCLLFVSGFPLYVEIFCIASFSIFCNSVRYFSNSRLLSGKLFCSAQGLILTAGISNGLKKGFS